MLNRLMMPERRRQACDTRTDDAHVRVGLHVVRAL